MKRSLHVGYVVDDFHQPLNHFINAELKYVSQRIPVTVFSLRRKHVITDPDLAGLPCYFLGDISVPRGFARSLLSRAVRGLLFPIAPRERITQLVLGHRIGSIAARIGVTHLHAHWAGMPATLAYLASLTSGIPYSLTGHASDMYKNRYPSLMMDKMQRSTFTVTISRYNKAYLVRQGIPPDKVKVVHCGVDAQKFSKSSKRPYRGRKDGETFRILSVGRLVAKKGFDVLIEAASITVSQGIDLDLSIVGEGDHMGRLMALASREGVDGRVHFLGRVTDEELAELYGNSDLFVLACKEIGGDMDGIPVSIMEAMSMGLPVVTSKVSGIPELVDSGTGFLARPGSPHELAELITAVAEDGGARVRASIQGGIRVASGFSAERSAEQLVELFSSKAGK